MPLSRRRWHAAAANSHAPAADSVACCCVCPGARESNPARCHDHAPAGKATSGLPMLPGTGHWHKRPRVGNNNNNVNNMLCYFTVINNITRSAHADNNQNITITDPISDEYTCATTPSTDGVEMIFKPHPQNHPIMPDGCRWGGENYP